MHQLISTERLAARVHELATAIRQDHPRGVHLIGVLNGSFVFLSDLMRAIPGLVTIDFIAVSSYGAADVSSGTINLRQDISVDIAGRDVVVVEDIVDTGLTLAYILKLLRARSPGRLRTAALLDKPTRRQVSVSLDYTGFVIEDVFVVGYGLDRAGVDRNLPFIGVPNP